MMATPVSDNEFRLFSELIGEYSGIQLPSQKKYLLESRLEPLLKQSEYPTYYLLYKACCTTPQIREQVLDAMTTKETSWFRMPEHFSVLRQNILPSLIDAYTGTCKTVRIWSAACATGQEAYSLAICASETFADRHAESNAAKNISILATDISTPACECTRTGRYNRTAMDRGLSDDRRQRWFDTEGAEWIVKPPLREMVSTKPYNLIEDFSCLGLFDVIFLRNVVIYFREDIKHMLYRRIAESLQPNGVLFLGTGESLSGYNSTLHQEESNGVIYYRRKD